MALEHKQISRQSLIKLRYTGPFMNLSVYYDDQAVPTCPVTQIEKGLIETTAGRIIFNSVLPKGLPFFNGTFRKKGIESLVFYIYLRAGLKSTVQTLDRLKELGFLQATQAGFSLGIDDFVVPKTKGELVEKAFKRVREVEKLYLEGTISARERFNTIINVWSTVTDEVSVAMIAEMKRISFETPNLNPLFVMADSGSRGNKQQIRQLAGMRGLMSKPSGEILETPITSNLREGLSVIHYFISTHGARKGLADTALKTANSGYLTRKLVDASQDVVVDRHDCGTLKGVNVTAIVENGEIVEPFVDRVVGRTSLERVVHPDTGKVLLDTNQEITDTIALELQNLGIEQVKIRSLLTCEAKRGVCQLCYGRNMASGFTVELGEAVGVVAAQSIGEPGTQLTMRTFHIGGIAMGEKEQSKIEAKNDGTLRFHNLRAVEGRDGKLVVVNRSANIAVMDYRGREVEHYQVPYGAKLLIPEGGDVKARQLFAEWDPFNALILTEDSGLVVFHDVVQKVTVEELQDEITGLMSQIIIESKDEKLQPRLEIVDPKAKDKHGKPVLLKRYFLPSGAHLEVKDGARSMPAKSWPRFPANRPRRKTSPAVFPGRKSCSKPAGPNRRPSSPRSTGRSFSAA